jgi:hypothetical protein
MQSVFMDIENRRPVWAALSELLLDTMLDDYDIRHMASILAASPYSSEELHIILFHEVYPILVNNMKSVAGVWTAFDEEWLEEAIIRRLNRVIRWPVCLQMNRGLIRDIWLRVLAEVEKKRAE